ncbi:MAG: TonB-dependent receptor plug domain-containing protein, partial [Maribacter sp.]
MRTKTRGILTLLLAFVVHLSFAQEKTVSGVVTDQSGVALPGVSVVEVGTTNGTQTDFDGNYTITVVEGKSLRFSYIGQKTITRNVGAGSTVNVQMEEDAQALEEVVVIGYGVQKKKEVTGAISSVDGSDIQGLVTPSFESQIAGRAAGVQVTSSNGIIGESPRIRIRGIASIGSGNDPLYVVDGVPILTGDLGGVATTNGLGDINPNDIESFDILKDGAATAIYGSRAANGVVLITTKKGKKGAMQVGYNVVTGYASPIKTFDLLETPDFLVIANEKRTNRGQEPWAIGNSINTDWQDAVLNSNALQVDHSLSLSGGSDKTKYYLSLGYT